MNTGCPESARHQLGPPLPQVPVRHPLPLTPLLKQKPALQSGKDPNPVHLQSGPRMASPAGGSAEQTEATARAKGNKATFTLATTAGGSDGGALPGKWLLDRRRGGGGAVRGASVPRRGVKAVTSLGLLLGRREGGLVPAPRCPGLRVGAWPRKHPESCAADLTSFTRVGRLFDKCIVPKPLAPQQHGPREPGSRPGEGRRFPTPTRRSLRTH